MPQKSTNQSVNPFSFVNGLNKGQPIEYEENKKQYVPYLINKTFSYFVDCLSYAQEMNKYSNLDHDQQYNYYKATIRPRSRFSKWSKPAVVDDLETIQKVFYCNKKRAVEILELVGDNIKLLEQELEIGGVRQK